MERKLYLYITPFFPSPKSWRGGYCLDAVKSLMRDGRYHVVVMTATDCGGDYEFEGVKVYQILRKRFGCSEYFETLLEPWNKRLFLRKLKRIGINFSNIAVCHVHDFGHYIPYAMALKKLNPKVLTLVHHHWSGRFGIGFGSFGCLPVLGELQFLHTRRLFESVDAHVFCSEESRSLFAQNVDYMRENRKVVPMTAQLKLGKTFRNIRYRDSYIWYNGVDSNLFFKGSDTHEGFRIGCVSNFNKGKCQEDLIEAFARVVDKMTGAKLSFVGSGFELARLQEIVRIKNISNRVSFIKEMSHAKLADYYRGLDLFVLPSVNEGFCCVFVEAHACGVPVIGCNNISLKEVLPGGGDSPWLIAPHDVKALADKILDFYKDRRKQDFSVDLDIDVLARKFLDWVDARRLRC